MLTSPACRPALWFVNTWEAGFASDSSLAKEVRACRRVIFFHLKVDIGLTLKNCGPFDKSEVGLQKPEGGHQESEGLDTRYVCSFMLLHIHTIY